jgi:hypothetical protein
MVEFNHNIIIWSLIMGLFMVLGNTQAAIPQDLKDFKVSTEVDADYSVPFPVDI